MCWGLFSDADQYTLCMGLTQNKRECDHVHHNERICYLVQQCDSLMCS